MEIINGIQIRVTRYAKYNLFGVRKHRALLFIADIVDISECETYNEKKKQVTCTKLTLENDRVWRIAEDFDTISNLWITWWKEQQDKEATNPPVEVNP